MSDAAREERSESGDPVYRYQGPKKDFEFAAGDPDSIAAIEKHIEKHIGDPANVFHELVSDIVHIDLHVVNPTPERNFYTIITSGMSDKPMLAAKIPQAQYSELLICLPPNWKLDQASFKDERNYWPLRWLKILARFPHEHDTWLWWGHTMPNGDPPEPFAPNTKLCGMLLLPPILANKEFFELKVNDQKTIRFFALIPLYREEMELKLKKGVEALFDGFDKNGVSELLDVSRRNTCARRWFGLGR